MRTIRTSFCLPVFLLFFLVNNLQAQPAHHIFGNGIQGVRTKGWHCDYTHPRYDLAWETDKLAAAQIVPRATRILAEIETKLAYQLRVRPTIFIFNKKNKTAEGWQEKKNHDLLGGNTVLAHRNRKVVVNYSADTAALDAQLRLGFARVCLEAISAGGSIQESFQSTVQFSLPEWFGEGIVVHCAQPFGAAEMADLNTFFKKNKKNTFYTLCRKKPALAGASFWQFVSATYGKSAVSNLFYLARLNHNVESGCYYALGIRLDVAAERWAAHYENIFLGKPTILDSAAHARVAPIGIVRTQRDSTAGRRYSLETNFSKKIEQDTLPPDSLSAEAFLATDTIREQADMPIASDIIFIGDYPEQVPAVADQHQLVVQDYRVAFNNYELSARLDNSLAFGGYDNYAGTGLGYQFMLPSIHLAGAVTDVFENYKLEAGIRIPVTFDATEVYVKVADYSRRIDKMLGYYRLSGTKRFQNAVPFQEYNVRNIADYFYFRMLYPFNKKMQLTSEVAYRTDKRLILDSDNITRQQPTYQRQHAGLRGEFAFDGSNKQKNGLRYMVGAGIWQSLRWGLPNNAFPAQTGLMTQLSATANYVLPLGSYCKFATQISGATSFGKEKMLYFLGGTRGEILPTARDQTVGIPVGNEWVWQQPVQSMRGFGSNIRNGNSYVLANAELRINAFSYLSKKMLSSAVLQNFQLVTFTDWGTAWQGKSPFAANNPLNTVNYNNPYSPVDVQVNYYRNPVVGSVGVGLRALILGYQARVDYAWGIESGKIQSPRLHLSLGVDF